MTRLLLSTIALAGFLAGCQSTPGEIVSSNTMPELSELAASAIAGDLSARFREQAGPPKSALRLRRDNSPFAVSLAASLKGWGYDLAGDDDEHAEKAGPSPVEIGYLLTDLDGDVLARMSTRALSVSRAYKVTATGATPISPLSVMKRN